MKETDLYAPIKRHFEEQGYEVDGEVCGCDVMAKRGDEIILVELKLKFQLQLVYQAMERQKLTPFVYVAIARPKTQKTTAWKNMLNLLKRLEVGLLLVSLDSPLEMVQIMLEPMSLTNSVKASYKKRKRLEKEFQGRTQKRTTGGAVRQKIMTAYKEKAIDLLCLLEREEMLPLQKLREYGKGEAYVSLLQKNFYGWFERIERGVYGLSDEGRLILENEIYVEVIAYYRKLYEEV